LQKKKKSFILIQQSCLLVYYHTVFFNHVKCTSFKKFWYAKQSSNQAKLMIHYKWCQILLFTLKYSTLQSFQVYICTHTHTHTLARICHDNHSLLKYTSQSMSSVHKFNFNVNGEKVLKHGVWTYETM
jgi:hypothetical protein